MADIPASNWSPTDASNTTASPDGMPEGMAPSGVNDWGRAVMGAVKRWYEWTVPKTTGGTTTAFTLSYTVAPGALVDGMSHLVQFNATSGASPTLNVNSLGAKPIYQFVNGAWAQITTAGTIPSGFIGRVSYNSGEGSYRLTSTAFPIGVALLAVANTFTALLTMSGAAINEAKGADIASATTTDIGAATGNYVKVTGTTTITGLGTIQAGTERTVEFGGALTLTHNGTSLILPGAANITTVAGDTAIFRSLGSGNWKCVQYTRGALAPGGVQVVTAASSSYSSGTTAIPLDDTIPQNTEGDEYMTATITPRTATSTLQITVTAHVTSSDGSQVMVALFQDSTAGALKASWGTPVTNGAPMTPIVFTHVMTSGTTSATTFKVRAGCAATTGFNGSGSRYLGGVMASSIVIRETL